MAEELYAAYDVLQSDVADTDKKASFKTLLDSVSSENVQIRDLAGRMLGTFAGLFPDQSEAVCDKLLELCAVDDVGLQRASIVNMGKVAGMSDDLLKKCVQGQTRLLAKVAQPNERLVRQNLLKCFEKNSKAALAALIEAIEGEDEEARNAAFALLEKIVQEHSKTILHPNAELERYLADELKKILNDVTREEFLSVVKMLNSLKIFSGNDCGQEIVDVLAEIADLEADFNPEDGDQMDRFLSCFQQTLSFYPKGANPGTFLSYIVKSILPKFDKLAADTDPTLQFMRTLASLTLCKVPDADSAAALPALHFVVLKLLPAMPSPAEGDALINPADFTDSFNFALLECALFAFRRLVIKSADFITDEINAERTAELRSRLQFAARVLQAGYISQLEAALKASGDDQEKRKTIQVALRMAKNIQTLIRALHKAPPSAQPRVFLSWQDPPKKKRPAPSQVKKEAGKKGRQQPPQKQQQQQRQRGQGGNKKQAQAGAANSRPQGVYQAPAGKYSKKAGTFDSQPTPGGGVQKRGRNRRRGNKRA